MSHCEGTCRVEAGEGSIWKRRGIYADGDKYCKPCEIYLEYNGLHCPCCGTLLRTRRRVGRLEVEVMRI